MNPTYVNRKKLIQHFQLSAQREKKTLEPTEEPNIKEDTLSSDTYDNSLSIDIKAVLPIIDDISDSTEYQYKLGQVLNTDRVNTSTKKSINLCIFNILENNKVPPIILYLLHKDPATNTMYFPHFTTNNKIMDEAAENINKIFKDWSSKPKYKGFLETQHNIYIFYEQKYSYVLEKINYIDKWWWGSMFEIINTQKILNFPIDRTVYSVFYKKPLLISLFKNDNRLTIPYISYVGGYYTYIAFLAAFGNPKQLPTSNLGPYYYFGDYHSVGKWAIWSSDRKEKVINDEIITINKYGIYKQGGIARYAIFGEKMKYFLNREDDPEDDSKISQDLAKEKSFFKETIKVRDVSAKWADKHDMAYIGSFLIDGKIKARRFNIQFAIRDYYQQVPLTYHYVDTSEFSAIEDEKQKELPYNYKDYNIA